MLEKNRPFQVQIEFKGENHHVVFFFQREETEGFLKLRSLFANSLNAVATGDKDKIDDKTEEAKKGWLNYEVSDAYAKRYKQLIENGELQNLYEELVAKEGGCITVDEFFNNLPAYASNEKLRKINEQELPRNAEFFTTNRREHEGKEHILMKPEDKQRLLEQFPELREQYQSRMLDKQLEDPDEEAKFWDNFWKLQKEKKTLLYGGEAKDSKDGMTNLPVFTGKEEQEEMGLEDAIEILNRKEQQDDMYEKYIFKLNKNDNNDRVADLLNNHSIMIKTKAKDHLSERARTHVHEPVSDPDFENARHPGMMEEETDDRPVQEVKRKQQASDEVYRNKFEPAKRKEIEGMWTDFLSERKRRHDSYQTSGTSF